MVNIFQEIFRLSQKCFNCIDYFGRLFSLNAAIKWERWESGKYFYKNVNKDVENFMKIWDSRAENSMKICIKIGEFFFLQRWKKMQKSK